MNDDAADAMDEGLDEAAEKMSPKSGDPVFDARVIEAAGWTEAAYVRQRVALAAELNIGVLALDKFVRVARLAGGIDQPGINQRDELVKIARKNTVFWRDNADTAYATVGGREHVRVKSLAYRRRLTLAYGDVHTIDGHPAAPGAQAMSEALAALDAQALRGSLEIPKLRVAGTVQGPAYLDLGDDSWRAVEITANGWRVIDDPPIKFVRAPGVLPLPVPTRGNKGKEKLIKHLGLEDAASRLVIGFQLGCFMPDGPYPILALHGEAGSGKTTLTRMLRESVDPNRAAERSSPKERRDLIIAANNAWVPSFGNLSSLTQDMSDDLCRISGGIGYAARALYTDMDETIFSASRPQIINGIPDLARSDDLADRCVNVVLPHRPESGLAYEAELWRAFAADLPEMLGFLLDCVACALRNLGGVTLARRPRLADFARWVEAAAPELGWEPGAFLADYIAARERMSRTLLEADVLGPVLMRMIALAEFTGTPTELLSRLNTFASDEEKKAKGWPANSATLGSSIRRLAPALRKIGWVVGDDRTGSARGISLSRLPPTAPRSPSSPSSPSFHSSGNGLDVTAAADPPSSAVIPPVTEPGMTGPMTANDRADPAAVTEKPSNGAVRDGHDGNDGGSGSVDVGGEHNIGGVLLSALQQLELRRQAQRQADPKLPEGVAETTLRTAFLAAWALQRGKTPKQLSTRVFDEALDAARDGVVRLGNGRLRPAAQERSLTHASVLAELREVVAAKGSQVAAARALDYTGRTLMSAVLSGKATLTAKQMVRLQGRIDSWRAATPTDAGR